MRELKQEFSDIDISEALAHIDTKSFLYGISERTYLPDERRRELRACLLNYVQHSDFWIRTFFSMNELCFIGLPVVFARAEQYTGALWIELAESWNALPAAVKNTLKKAFDLHRVDPLTYAISLPYDVVSVGPRYYHELRVRDIQSARQMTGSCYPIWGTKDIKRLQSWLSNNGLTATVTEGALLVRAKQKRTRTFNAYIRNNFGTEDAVFSCLEQAGFVPIGRAGVATAQHLRMLVQKKYPNAKLEWRDGVGVVLTTCMN